MHRCLVVTSVIIAVAASFALLAFFRLLAAFRPFAIFGLIAFIAVASIANSAYSFVVKSISVFVCYCVVDSAII